MKEVRAALVDIVKEVSSYKEYMVGSRVEPTKAVCRVVSFVKNRAAYIKQVLSQSSSNSKNIKNIVDSHQGYLYFIHDVLVGTIMDLYVEDADKVRLRSAHDMLMKGCFDIGNVKRRFARLATWLCTRLCKGITFFDNDTGITHVPFYHRDHSCGDKGMTATERFVASKANVTYLINCYIERKIYDYVYTRTMHIQDVGHLYELGEIERLYQKFNPGEQLVVEVKFNDDIHPNHVCITRTRGHGLDKKALSIEEYTWTSDWKRVNCKKLDANGLKYEKVQTATNEEPWVAVSPEK